MKKVLLFALTALFSLSLLAKDVVIPEFKCFIPNERQECEQTFTFPTSKSAKEALDDVMRVINSGDFNSSISDRTDAGFSFNGNLQTENRYNPFAGTFKTTLAMKGEVTFADGKVTIHFSDFFIDHLYSGFGMNQNRFNVNDVIRDINTLRNTVANATGKEKKQANEELEDKVDIVSESDAELYKRMLLLESRLSK